ncbi:MAG TPA: CaiB/BaiF CoA-transferase family protein [Stellaceae bacterium]|jgi:crotonobetainyl-CoA:carnitine CoA-transferase CaiB-like acyl-CoA transferase|nr:CaiB/BaiF CoA-transferase family protein [Stellaceae bacterium]
MPGPLAEIRVFDMSRVLAGPSCAQLLGDLGADVIKVERPGEGDDTRKWGPPYLKDTQGRDTTESAYYLSANRAKRSLTLDFTKAAGRDLARRLIACSDVLIENYKVGTLAKHGLGYPELRAEFPRLVYCSITGFGQTGPYAPRAGYDYLIQAMGGIMSLTGEPGGEPMKVAVAIADLMTGMYSSVAILAALRHRDATGEGQHIDMALLDTQIAWLANLGQSYLTSGDLPARLGNAHATVVPYQVFKTSDGHIVVAIGNDGQFRKFCDFAGAPALARDPRFATNPARIRQRDELIPEMSGIIARQSSAYWIRELERVGVPCGPINDLAQVFADPQVQARRMTVELPHPAASGEPTRLIANPIRLSQTPIRYDRAPPTLGQHTDEVLRELLDLSAAEIAALRNDGVI